MIKQIIKIYRVDNWIKTFGICVLGLLMNKSVANFSIFLIGMLQSFMLFSFLYVFDDFNDFLVEKRKKYIGKLVSEGKVSFRFSWFLVLIPLSISLFISLLFYSPNYFTVYLIFIFFVSAYSMPKIRMGDKPFFDVIFNIIFFSLLFIQAILFSNNGISENALFLLLWFGSYVFSLELIHELAHFSKDSSSSARTLGKEATIKMVKASFLAVVLVGIFLLIKFPELKLPALILTISASTRLVYFRNLTTKTDFNKIRNRMGGLLEGIAYAIIFLT